MTDGAEYLYVLGGDPSNDHIDFAELESFRFSNGGGFPASYQTFIRQYGWARTFGLWLVYPPVQQGFADGWQRAANRLRPIAWTLLLLSSSLRALDLCEGEVGAAFEFWVGAGADLESS